MDLSGPWPGLAMTVMTLLPSLDEILRPPKLGLFLLLPSTKEVVRGREELIAIAAKGKVGGRVLPADFALSVEHIWAFCLGMPGDSTLK